MTAGGRSPNAARAGRPVEPRATQLLDQRVLGVALARAGAAVEDRGLARLEREREVPAQVLQLGVPGREHPVRVQPGLPDRDDALVVRPGVDRRPAGSVDLRGVVRVDAHGGVKPRPSRGQLQRPLGRAHVPARDEDPLQAREPRCADDQLDVGIEAVRVEVPVGIDQAHRRVRVRRASVSRRVRRRRPRRQPRSRRAGTAGPAYPSPGPPHPTARPTRGARAPPARRCRPGRTGTGSRAGRGSAARRSA